MTHPSLRLFFIYAGLACALLGVNPARAQQEKSCPAVTRMQVSGSEGATIRFVGDLVLGNQHIVDKVPKEWDALYFEAVQPYLETADATVGNLEGAITSHSITAKDTKSGRAFAFRFPLHYASLLRQAGFTALHVANNHSHDFGERGFADTLQQLSDANIAIVGLKESFATLTVKGIKVAIVGFGFYPRNNMLQDLRAARALIERARSEATFVIATFHGGAEGDAAVLHPNDVEMFMSENRGNSVAFARNAIEAGADVVVGHGPHVLRSIECYQGKPVFYSLGNFVGVGGLSTRGIAALSGIAGVQLDLQGNITQIEFLPVVMDTRKLPKPDSREFASHLINWTGEHSKFPGQFLAVPAKEDSKSAFQDWLGPFYPPSKP